jgi:anaphase-promoting complex subunit 3
MVAHSPQPSTSLDARLLTAAAEQSLRALLPTNAVFLADMLVARHPSDASRTLLARAHLAAGFPVRAAAALMRATSPESRYLRAAILSQRFGDESALRDAEAALRGRPGAGGGSDLDSNTPGGAAGLFLLASICQRTARKEEAVRLYRRALSLNPTLWVAAEALAALGVVSSPVTVLGSHDDFAALALLTSQPKFSDASAAFLPDSTLAHAHVMAPSGTVVAPIHFANTPAPSTAPHTPHRHQTRLNLASTPPPHQQHAANPRTPIAPALAAPPCTPAQPPAHQRRPRARYTTPSPGMSVTTTPAMPGAPGRRVGALGAVGGDGGAKRSGRLFATPDTRDASVVSRILGATAATPQPQGTPHGTPQQPAFGRTPQHHVQNQNLPRQGATPLSVAAATGQSAGVKATVNSTAGGDSTMDIIRHLLQTVGALGQYKCTAAIRLASQLPPCHRDSSFVLGVTGRAYLELGDYSGAEAAFRKSLAVDPVRLNGVAEYYSTVLWHLKKETQLAELAIDSFNKDRHNAATWCSVGNCYSLQRDPDAALRFFKRATRVDPHNAYAHTLAGHEYVVKENFDAALASYRQALVIDDRHYNALYGIGQVLQKQEKFALAERHFRAALRVHPRNSNLHYHLGVALAASATAAASAAVAAALTADPSVSPRQIPKSSLLMPALKELETAATLDPRNPVPKFERAKLLMQMDRLSDARAQLEALRDALPKEAAVYHELGRVCKRMGDRKAALRCFNYALDIDPKDQGRRYKKAIDTLFSSGPDEDS